METVYLVSLIVGGFFVLLSIFGGAETDADADADFDFDADADVDLDFDADHDVSLDGDHDLGGGLDAGPGFVDLFSIRALFLFAAFFGLTGSLLTWTNAGATFTAVMAVLMGLMVGLGGNYIIKRVAYKHVSSDVTNNDLKGKTGQVLLPFEGGQKGKITLIVKGSRLQLPARALGDTLESFERGEEVVVVRVEGSTVEVVKPN